MRTATIKAIQALNLHVHYSALEMTNVGAITTYTVTEDDAPVAVIRSYDDGKLYASKAPSADDTVWDKVAELCHENNGTSYADSAYRYHVWPGRF